jgi:hypothetical protein
MAKFLPFVVHGKANASTGARFRREPARPPSVRLCRAQFEGRSNGFRLECGVAFIRHHDGAAHALEPHQGRQQAAPHQRLCDHPLLPIVRCEYETLPRFDALQEVMLGSIQAHFFLTDEAAEINR